MSQQNWGIEVDAIDYFGHQKKQLQVADRRPVIRTPSDLVGPGIASAAIRITDFNDLLATFNGYYSADIEAASAPNDTDQFIGHVVMDDELGGRQVFTSLDTGEEYTRVFLRSPSDPDFIAFGAWRPAEFITPTLYSEAWYSTTIPDVTDTYLLVPDIETFGTPLTFEKSPTTINILRPGVYTGYASFIGPGPYVEYNMTVEYPNGSIIREDFHLSGEAQINTLPLHFWASDINGYLRIGISHATGTDQSAIWERLCLSRIGDAP